MNDHDLHDVLRFYQDGGWFVNPILFLAVLSAIGALLALLLRSRVAGVIALAFAGLCSGSGWTAYQRSIADSNEVLQTIVPEQYAMASSRNEESARAPLYFSVGCATPGFIFGLLSLVRARGRRPTRSTK